MSNIFPVGEFTTILDANHNGSYDVEDNILVCSPCGNLKDTDFKNKYCRATSVDRQTVETLVEEKSGYSIATQSVGLAELSLVLSTRIFEDYALNGSIEMAQCTLSRMESMAAEYDLPFDQEWAMRLMSEGMVRILNSWTTGTCRWDDSGLVLVRSAKDFLGLPFNEREWLSKNNRRKACPADW